jgi:hypothetical protein
MEKNLYFRTAVRRDNVLSRTILNLALKCASFPRALIEVFIRQDMGLRYFSVGTVLFLAIVLGVFPLIGDQLGRINQSYPGSTDGASSFWLHYGSWYLYLVAFLYFSWKRWAEIRLKPGVFDNAKYTLYEGDIHPRFFMLHPLGQKPSIRSVEVYYEPGVFFVLGLVLWWLLGQPLGLLLMIVSVLYGLSYAGAYKQGNDFIMDKMDEMILNEEYEDAFVNGNHNNSRGARYHISRPTNAELRELLRDSIIVEGSDTATAE